MVERLAITEGHERSLGSCVASIHESLLAAEQAADGNFDTAMQLLSLGTGMNRRVLMSGPLLHLCSISLVGTKAQRCYRSIILGRVNEALRLFLGILHTIPLIVVESGREVDQVRELILTAKEYALAYRWNFIVRIEDSYNHVRQQELAAYFTHFNLQLPHLRLVLMNAMTVCYVRGNLITASNFAKRILKTKDN
ncbi:Coatomer, alpha subunit, C-terminal [Artemisia annua]|uniref:Coatomer, alpha subunit, C-terminal n=1 Tax=Artemisia annua TaxID=35608 RepID=A0A2U1M3V3_ARTAN|nr:Coatomer, alpha subunit, C-terminal [Artemisia annua]